jgi:hypothetical protein
MGGYGGLAAARGHLPRGYLRSNTAPERAFSSCPMHEVLLERLVRRLERTGEYETLITHHEFERGRLRGEIDVWAVPLARGVQEFYEVKSCRTADAVRKARRQARNATAAFGEYGWSCYLVTPARGGEVTIEQMVFR